MADIASDRLNFWDRRASLGLAAGTGDVNLKQLEINAILRALGDPATVLDAGCGNAYTLMELATQIPECKFFGFDYSSGMVDAGKQLINQEGLADKIYLCQGDLMEPPVEALQSLGAPAAGFECVYTERSLINLDRYEDQVQVIHALWNLTASGGRLVLCEAFSDGLNEINYFRESVDLPAIRPPWHNRYFTLDEIKTVLDPGLPGPEIVEFSGTYYFVSRVIHARSAFLAGNEPSYAATINLESLDLPALPLCGQSKIVIFRKP
jgi:ubiquinone/menaquinone biosynthesis C-methylase UbiE